MADPPISPSGIPLPSLPVELASLGIAPRLTRVHLHLWIRGGYIQQYNKGGNGETGLIGRRARIVSCSRRVVVHSTTWRTSTAERSMRETQTLITMGDGRIPFTPFQPSTLFVSCSFCFSTCSPFESPLKRSCASIFVLFLEL